MEKLNERILRLRKLKGMTQLQLAEKLNVSDKAVSKWESGKCDPSLDLIKSLAKLFNCSIDYLVNGKDVVSFLRNDKEFAEKCFELLKESVAPEAYNKFFANFRFIKIDGEEFVFETCSQEVYDEVFDTDRHDEVGDRLIEIAMSLDKKINGWGVYLVNK